MLVLGFESSAKSASVALMRDNEIIAEYFQNCGLTHSRTLLPMAEDLLKNTGISMGNIDFFAIAHGPGSFTGIRIGVSCVKGLCWALEKPAVGVSTLEAMAHNGAFAPEESVICCCMDARRNQIYNALFLRVKDGFKRISPDRAISLEALYEELKSTEEKVFLVGDGAKLCLDYLTDKGLAAQLAPEPLIMQRASGVCRAAAGEPPVSAADLLPVYLRLSQAERERQEHRKTDAMDHARI